MRKIKNLSASSDEAEGSPGVGRDIKRRRTTSHSTSLLSIELPDQWSANQIAPAAEPAAATPAPALAVRRPPFFQLDLLEHQPEGVRFLTEQDAGGLFVYEMGLGKTCMVLAVLCQDISAQRSAGGRLRHPHLVIVPKSAKPTWQEDFDKFVDHRQHNIRMLCDIKAGQFTDAAAKAIRSAAYDIVVVSYDQVRREYSTLVSAQGTTSNRPREEEEEDEVVDSGSVALSIDGRLQEPSELAAKAPGSWLYGTRWATLTLDEAHTIRNATTKQYAACYGVHAKRRFYVTGTPLQNSTTDVYNALKFIRAPDLVDKETWHRLTAEARAKHLTQLSRQHIKWVKRGDVPAAVNPDVTLDIFHLKLEFASTEEAQFYSSLCQHMSNTALLVRQARDTHLRASDPNYKSAVHIFAAITLARQACIAPCVPDLKNLPPHILATLPPIGANSRRTWACLYSTKLLGLRYAIREHVKPDEKFLVFSNIIKSLDLSQEILRDEFDIQSVRLTGDMSGAERQAAERQFKTDPKTRAFCISMKAGGVALNLEQATTVIMLDTWWNWQVMLQAFYRAYRITSTRSVQVIILSVHDTIEDVILKRADEKRIEADKLYASTKSLGEMFDAATAAPGTSREDLQTLLRLIDESTQSTFAALRKLKPSSELKVFDEKKVREERARKTRELLERLEVYKHPSSLPDLSRSSEGTLSSSPPLITYAPLYWAHLNQIPADAALWELRVDATMRAALPSCRSLIHAFSTVVNPTRPHDHEGVYLHWHMALFRACEIMFEALDQRFRRLDASDRGNDTHRHDQAGLDADAALQREVRGYKTRIIVHRTRRVIEKADLITDPDTHALQWRSKRGSTAVLPSQVSADYIEPAQLAAEIDPFLLVPFCAEPVYTAPLQRAKLSTSARSNRYAQTLQTSEMSAAEHAPVNIVLRDEATRTELHAESLSLISYTDISHIILRLMQLGRTRVAAACMSACLFDPPVEPTPPNNSRTFAINRYLVFATVTPDASASASASAPASDTHVRRELLGVFAFSLDPIAENALELFVRTFQCTQTSGNLLLNTPTAEAFMCAVFAHLLAREIAAQNARVRHVFVPDVAGLQSTIASVLKTNYGQEMRLVDRNAVTSQEAMEVPPIWQTGRTRCLLGQAWKSLYVL